MKLLACAFASLLRTKYLNACKEPWRGISTIYALSSGQGKCGVAVVRISGSNARAAISAMTRPSSIPLPRMAVLRSICHPLTNEVLDRGLVLWFPGQGSFTGENCVELQVHGGAAVLAAITAALACLPSFRHALPGEFTRRAFANGKLDLTGVEGLADLLNAETEAQRRQAIRQSCGGLASLYQSWQQQLLETRAVVEAYLDFGEEGHEEMSEISGEVERRVRALCETISGHLCDGRRGEILRAGVKLCIVGRPNVGKSSLLNVLLQRPAAIVSPVPGTTRDIVSGTLDIGGYPVNILDSAGLRDGADVVEKEGIRRAVESAVDSDAAIVVIEASQLVSRLRGCGHWENDCENKNGGRQVLEHDSRSHKTGINTALKERVFVNNSKLPSEGLNVVNDIVDVNGEPKTPVKNEVPINSLELNNNSNTMGKQNCWPYSKKVRLVLLDILSELFKEKLSSMRWLEESSFLVLLNKIDLLNSHDRDFLSLCLSPFTDASGNITCPKSESNMERNHQEVEVKPSLVSSTFTLDSAPSSVGSIGDSSYNNSIYDCKNKTGDGNNNNISDSINKSNYGSSAGVGSGDKCNNVKLVRSSLLHNEGVNDLLWSLTRLCERLCWSGDAEQEAPHITSARHRTHVADALECLLTVLGEQERYESMCGVSQTFNYCAASFSDGRCENPVEHGVNSPSRTTSNQIEGVRGDGQTCVSWEIGPGNFSSSASDSFDTNGDWDFSDFSKRESISYQPLQKFGSSVNSVNQLNLLAHESTLDVAAHYLFLAARHLGQITGHVSNEKVLDQIFSTFCIGK